MSEGLSWAAAIDTSQFDDGMRRIEEGVRDAASNIEFESEKIQSLFTDIPEIDIKAVTNIPQTADEIGEAYASIAKYQRINEEAISELTEEYNRLTLEINKFRNIPEKKDEVAKWRMEKTAISENINLRRDMIRSTEDLTKIVEKNEKAFLQHQKTQSDVKMRIREVMQEMAALVNEAQMNGEAIDETSGRYRELAEELGRLKDIQGDIATQARVLSNDENQFEGVISGLSGLSGGFTAAQGAMALFGSENENLQKVMTQLQAVMAITMGLQQMQQMLNKDSAFRLVTLNSLRNIWNKLMGESNAVTAANTSETATNAATTEAQVAATEAQAVATAQQTVAEEANTAAQKANNTATNAGSTATAGNTAATQGATMAQNAHTGAMVSGTVATNAMTVAMRVLKLAIISTGIGGLIVLVGELVSWITDLISKEDEATKQAKALGELNKEVNKTYMEQKVKLDDNIKACQNFKGTKEQERKKVEELNSEYGSALGYYDSLDQWERVLIERGPKYLELLRMKAERQGVLNAMVDAYVDMLDMKARAERGDFDRSWINPARWVGNSNKWRREHAERAIDEVKDAVATYDFWVDKLTEEDAKLTKFEKENNFDNIHIDPKSVTLNGGKGSGTTFDPKQAAKAQREALNRWVEAVSAYVKQANEAVTQANLNSMEEGLAKELAQIKNNTDSQIEAWKQGLLQLAEERKAYEQAIYLSQKGHTEEDWLATGRGKMSIQNYAEEYLKDPANAELAKQYYDHLNAIAERGQYKLNSTVLKYRNQWIKEYGTFNQKDEVLTQEWTTRLNRIAAEAPQVLGRAITAMDNEIDRAKFERIKQEFNWESVFENYENLSSATLSRLITQLENYRKQVENTYDPEIIREYNDALNKLKAAQRANDNKFWSNLVPSALREQKEYQEQINDAKATYNHLCDLQKDKEEEVKNQILEMQRLLKEMTGEDYDISIISDPDKLQGIIDILKKTDPVGAGNLQNMSTALQGIQVDLGGITQAAGEAGMALEGMETGGMDTIAIVGKIVHAINDSIQSAKAIVDDLANTADALGADTEIGSGWDNAKNFMAGFAEASEGATQAFEAFKSGNPMGVVQGVVKSFTSWIRCFAAIKDAKHERTIKQIQERVDRLQDSYSRLDRAIDKVFSADASRLLSQQAKMIQQQRDLIQMQIKEEAAKKKTDWDKIKDWEKQLKDLEEEYEDVKEKAVDALFGHDIKSAIENFADAYADAWSANESRVASARDTVREMMQDMVKESLKAAIQSSGAMEQIRQRMMQYFRDGVFDSVERHEIYRMAEELQRELDGVMGANKELFYADSFSQNFASQAWGSMTTEDASALQGRFTALCETGESIRAVNASIAETARANLEQSRLQSDLLQDSLNIQVISMGHLETLSSHTRALAEMKESLVKIEKHTRNL